MCLLGLKRHHEPAVPASSADPRLCACPSPFGRAAPPSMPLVSQSAGSPAHSTWPSTPTRQASQSALPLSRVKSNQGTVLVCLSWGTFCLQSACQFGAATALTGRALCSRAAWASTGCSAACGGPLAHTSSVPLSFSATLPTWASPFAHPSPPLHPPLQLFHVAVVVAACVHYKAVRVLLAWRDATGGCLPPLDLSSLPTPPAATPPLLA